MYVQNMEQFVEDAQFGCASDYKHDFGVILTEYELEELHRALNVVSVWRTTTISRSAM